MACTSACSLKFSPPTATSPNPPSIPKATQVLRASNERWRRRCMEGMACLVIGLGVGNWVPVGDGNAMISVERVEVISQSNVNNTVSRWSDKRTCPPWHLNSLETIVPENLPRRSATNRRWEAVGYTKNAPAVKVLMTVKRTTNCFSM